MAKAKKLSSGNWRVLQYAGLDSNGKRIYNSFTAPTKEEAEQNALDFKYYGLTHKSDERMEACLTFDEAVDQYINSKCNILSPSTVRGYRIAQKNAFDMIKNVPLPQIDELLLQRWANNNALHYKSKSIRNQFGLITAVFRQNKRFLDFKSILLKPKEKPEYNIPDEQDMAAIFKVIEGKKIEIPVLLALMLGLRQSEIAALCWADYRDNDIHIHAAHVPNENHKLVRKERAKSFAGNRVIPDIPQYLKEKLDAADKTDKYISPYRYPSSVLRAFKRELEKEGLPLYKMHELRHANASVMLLKGIPDKYAMERLGQSTTYMLKNVYQHTFKSEQTKIAKQVNDSFSEILKKK